MQGTFCGNQPVRGSRPPWAIECPGDHFRWYAVAGQWAPLVWHTTTPRGDGPCGTVVDRNSVLLFSYPHRYYTQFAGVHPILVEGLLAPFHIDGQAVGTVWVVAHDESRKFDREDRRLLESLASFAAAAYQVWMANEHLQAEIAERQRAVQALLEADRRRSEFLVLLGHELRHPLAPIRNGVDILREVGGDAQKVKPVIEMMQRQIGQIVRLVDDLLDVHRISRGKLELCKERVELTSVVHHAVEACRPSIEEANQKLVVRLPAKPLYLDADSVRLVEVISNLLSNACKFTGQGGRIWLTVKQEGGQAVLRVRDTGIGIASGMLLPIFDRFTQVDSFPERPQGGLGLGLTLVKGLVEQHGGTVEAHSAGIGQGSEFTVRLPVAGAPPTKSAMPAVGDRREITPRRILVVDDDRDSAESLSTLLKLAGHQVSTVFDGDEAVERAATLRPEVVLLDIGLPVVSGYETARRIRAQPWGKGMLLVAVTGWGNDADREKARQAGFDAHLVKPVDPALLIELLAATPAS
ncbi:ATP-binding protein [Cupriavidus sp. D39]|uniref:hybrid sensor histidine kinase/response regulator n=1 Tax=Cupriavidus sp. D39 TaxID=2997877 RepID=UPI00226D521F|nr:ATP-binding protein [Cupriavidus sp. D39]MCY0853289.1 ATP-binding protein [Cupriavidus sp. D39]